MNTSILEALKTALLTLFTMFVDFIRSAQAMVVNAKIWNTCEELGVIFINFLREVFDSFVN